MKETRNHNHRQHRLPSRLKVISFALTLAGALGCLLFASSSFAQENLANPENSLVYIADSENQRLNWRLRELLSAAFGESVMIRSFVPGQTSQDSESPVIAIGPTAFSRIRDENRQVPVLGLLVEEVYVNRRDQEAGDRISAVLSTPPLLRQAAIGRAILPYSTRVAMLARPATEHLYSSMLDDLAALGMEGRVFLVPTDDRLIPTLIRALSYGDFVLAAPDSTIYNPRTIKHILLTAYRRNRIVIGPSQAYVKAGALASSYTPLSEVAKMASDYVRHFWQHNEFPAPAHPAKFGIEINRQVGKSLNIPLPERQALIDTVTHRLDGIEASSDD
jgi:ABC-type uncharacterized transport system substrate-binding protein